MLATMLVRRAGLLEMVVTSGILACIAEGGTHGATEISHGILKKSSMTASGRMPVSRGILSESLRLRGGGDAEVVHPTVWWSQRIGTVLMKVDMPHGMHKAEGLKVEGKTLTWHEGVASLDLELHGELNVATTKVECDGCVSGPHFS